MIALICIISLCLNLTALASDGSPDDDSIETEVQSFQEYNEWNGEIDQSVDGIYNTNPNSRVSLTGILNLSKSGTKVVAQYSTTYVHDVNRIGVRNIRLMYKTTLGIWNTIVTLDDRYRTNASSCSGAFSVTGTPGRTYMLSATHYYNNAVSSDSKYNETGSLKFN